MLPSVHPTIKSAGFLSLLLLICGVASAQKNSIASARLSEAEARVLDTEPPPMRLSSTGILTAFIKAETQVREALNQHTFKRDVVLQTIGSNGQVTGEYVRNSQFLFDDKGNRIERVTYHPPSTIREMRITREDVQDLAGAQLLGLDIVESTKYRLSYAGDESLDDRPVHIVVVEPSIKPNPNHMSERFFCGRVWIDAETFQIVKIRGVVEPHGKQRFPVFQTWRGPISNSLYLPIRTEADDVLHFPHRDVQYRIRVRYHDYKLFASKLKLTEIDEPVN